MLERPGEERARRCGSLERRPVRAEADDDEARVHAVHRVEQHLHALLFDQLPEVENGRRVVREEGGQARRVALVGQALFGVVRVRRIASGLIEQRGERVVARA